MSRLKRQLVGPPCPVTRSLQPQVNGLSRREFVESAVAGGILTPIHVRRLAPIVVALNVMFDQAAHSNKGLNQTEMSRFSAFQEKARREYATSGIYFDVRMTEGAYTRQQGYSEIPDKFLVSAAINVFVTITLGYDIDRDRTGGSSMGPHGRGPRSAPDPYYKTFLGLKDAGETTLEHEYAHHFTLDTLHRPTTAGNFWADLRNDYWLWRQRHGAPIEEFRACAGSPWAKLTGSPAVDKPGNQAPKIVYYA